MYEDLLTLLAQCDELAQIVRTLEVHGGQMKKNQRVFLLAAAHIREEIRERHRPKGPTQSHVGKYPN